MLGLVDGVLGLDDGVLGLDDGCPDGDGGVELAVLGDEGAPGVEGCEDVVALGHPARSAQSATISRSASQRAAGDVKPPPAARDAAV